MPKVNAFLERHAIKLAAAIGVIGYLLIPLIWHWRGLQ